MRRFPMRRWMALWTMALGLALGTAASAEPVSGMDTAVGVSLSRSEIQLANGKVLVVDDDTAITDVDRKVTIRLADIDVAEGVREIPLRYYGQEAGGVIRAIRVDIGRGALVN